MLDDALSENPVRAVLDDWVSSLSAGKGCSTAPSHQAPSYAMLDDGVSPKSTKEDAQWHPVSKHLLSGVLDDIRR